MREWMDKMKRKFFFMESVTFLFLRNRQFRNPFGYSAEAQYPVCSSTISIGNTVLSLASLPKSN